MGQTNWRFWVRGASICDRSPERRTIALRTRGAGERRFGDRKRLVATFLSLPIMSPGHAMEIKPMGNQVILSGPVVAADYDAGREQFVFQTANKDDHSAQLARRACGDRLNLGQLFRLHRDQGCHAAARDLLAPVSCWFTEGFGTPDLKSARSLLESL